MCRSIRVLAKSEPPASSDDIHAAARQFVRKIGGIARPSKANEVVFEAAVDEIAAVAERFLTSIRTTRSRVARAGPDTVHSQA